MIIGFESKDEACTAPSSCLRALALRGHACGRIEHLLSGNMQSLKSSLLQRQVLRPGTAGSVSKRAITPITRTATPQRATAAQTVGSDNG